MKTISVKELKEQFEAKENFILLDVRTDQEVFISKIEHSVHIPMNEIPERLDELDKSKLIIVQCKSGKRSARVCEFLQHNNFDNVKNLTGGILAWAKEIDPSITVF